MKGIENTVIVGAVVLFASIILSASTSSAKGASLVELSEGKTYSSYDITGDGKNDTIRTKCTKNYMDDSETEFIITINDSDKVTAKGYKDVHIYVFSCAGKSALVYEAVAGTASYSPCIINYDGGAYTETDVWWDGGWTAGFNAGEDCLCVDACVKGSWWLKSFEELSGVPFFVESKYVFEGNNLVKKTDFLDLSKPEVYSIKDDTVITGQTLETATEEDGFTLEKHSNFTITQVYSNDEGYFYKVEQNGNIGWVKDSSDYHFYYEIKKANTKSGKYQVVSSAKEIGKSFGKLRKKYGWKAGDGKFSRLAWCTFKHPKKNIEYTFQGKGAGSEKQYMTDSCKCICVSGKAKDLIKGLDGETSVESLVKYFDSRGSSATWQMGGQSGDQAFISFQGKNGRRYSLGIVVNGDDNPVVYPDYYCEIRS
ncbi:MAG: hypothetical protein IKQ97_08130 [Eubacterium sp.]|nr:hypothetical protein [Eubacterium sp.]